MAGIDFRFTGIGKLVSEGRLRVPVNQREYAWSKEHATELCVDLHEAMRRTNDTYFMGTVVLTRSAREMFEVVDGQQRLATVTMIIAAIRDIFHGQNEVRLVETIESQYLSRVDVETEADLPNLTLNIRDHDFFLNTVLLRPDDKSRKSDIAKKAPSNEKIFEASQAVRSYLEGVLKPLSENSKKDELKSWISYLLGKAEVIVLTAADDSKAYVMFETLNDRGLKVSQADLVKNLLFGRAGSKLPTAQSKWASIVSALETVEDQDSVIDFLRISMTLMHGLTREREVFGHFKRMAGSQHNVLQLLERLEELSIDYVAMLSPSHWKWNDYASDTRRSLATLHSFDITQIRPLMLAVASTFSIHETRKAYRLFVNWMVRLFIAGAGRVGRVEAVYSSLAHDIYTKETIKTAADLSDRMTPNLANDRDFEAAFATAHVSKARLARYYLGSLERSVRNKFESGLVPDDDVNSVNLEHILPLNRGGGWANFDEETAGSYVHRLGNLALMTAGSNSRLGSASFERKKAVLKDSEFQTTKMVANFLAWGPFEIDSRQLNLAKGAAKIWPLRINK